jgi:hypothetical protein
MFLFQNFLSLTFIRSQLIPLQEQEIKLADEEMIPFWICSVCTVHNYDYSVSICDTCGEKRNGMNGNVKINVEPSSWVCKDCTFENFDMNSKKCEICNHLRQK